MNFDLVSTPLHRGVNRLQASAGTGKTFALAGLYLRLLLEEKVSARDILVVTFTEAATAELRDRIRRRLTEALAVLEEGASTDPLLLKLAAQVQPRLGAAIQSLRNALEVFDLVSIYTIHGFCQRTLQDTAFESGILFDMELVTDQDGLIREVAADYCRNQLHGCQEVMASAALQAKLNPDTLARLLRQYLTYPELKLVTTEPPRPLEIIEREIQTSFQRCVEAWNSLAAGRAGLVGYFVSPPTWTIKEHAKRAVVDLHARCLESCRDGAALSSEFWDAVQFFSTSAVRAETGSKKQLPSPCPTLFEPCEKLTRLVAEYATGHRLTFLRTAREALAERKHAAKQQSYDDLITRLAEALDGPSGAALELTIRGRYRAALIDESQDTDPLQWKIFQRVFANRPDHWLYLIGDPKQAIYGFRGADVNTYLKAAATAQHKYSLGTNWRSESALVHAVNALFSNADKKTAFLEEHIQFEPVQPGLKAEGELMLFPSGEPRPAPFQVWCWEPGGGTVSSDQARKQLPVTVAAEISRLLKSKAVIGPSRIIQPRDIAVLVESHKQARWIQSALHDLGIPSVEQAMESVLESAEARELQWILAAVLAPGREAGVKSALTTDALGRNGSALQALVANESNWQARLQTFARYRELWETYGFFFMFVQLLRQEQVIENLLRFPDAERRITNVLHLAEILEAACKAEHLGPSQLVQWLEERRTGDEAAPEEFQLRLESDEDAVQIVTIHRSKGLQYPVVFCPFVSKDAKLRQIKINGQKVMDLVLYHDPESEKLSWDIDAEPNAENSQLAAREQLAEQVRLLYVALTRARNRCYLVSARYGRNKSTALAWLLHRSDSIPEDPVAALNEAPHGWKARWHELAAAAESCGGKPAIDVNDLPIAAGEPWRPEGLAASELRPRVCKRNLERSWYLSSFTHLASQLSFRSAADEEGGLPHQDEITAAAGIASGGETAEAEAQGIFALPACARTGDCLHQILERFEFSEPDEAKTRSLVREQLEASGLWSDPHAAAVTEMLGRLRHASLDPGDLELTLARVPASQRLTEVEFYFPTTGVDARQLMELIRSPGATTTRSETLLSPGQVQAFLKGFIDLVFVFQGRYHIIDWKSNRLGNRADDYTQQAMKAEVEENCYDLQYHIYTVALDKFLRQRLPGYDFDRDFGGVHYIFLRGLDPTRPELGVFNDRPSSQVIAGLVSRFGNFAKVAS